jgi:hypothetical protein
MSDVNRAASADQPLPVAEAMRRRAPSAANQRPPRARPYLRLLWIIPGLALLGAGLYKYHDVKDDGAVHTVQLTTKPGMVGQASEALRLVSLGTPDLYLKIKVSDGQIKTFTHKDTPIGNGLKWSLDKPLRMRDVREVEVWDEDAVRDNFADRVALGGTWSAEGQTYRIDLLGERAQPPKWALPVAVAGAVVTLVVLLRFVWDQVI